MTDIAGDVSPTAKHGKTNSAGRARHTVSHQRRPARGIERGESHTTDRLEVSVDDLSVSVAPATVDDAVDAWDGAAALHPDPGSATALHPDRGRGAELLREFTKRSFDVLFASLMLILMLPAFLAIVLAVRVSSPGPAFYRQRRIGRGGTSFWCWKFRTMYTDADERLNALIASDPHMRDEFVMTRKLRRDPRTTGFGRVLRRTSLDELPQLLNVLSGDMSIVGPRPIQDDETILYGDSLPAVQRVRPGLTGLWQVSGRNDLPYDVRVQLDEQYSNTHCLLFDLKIVCKTVLVVLLGRGAY